MNRIRKFWVLGILCAAVLILNSGLQPYLDRAHSGESQIGFPGYIPLSGNYAGLRGHLHTTHPRLIPLDEEQAFAVDLWFRWRPDETYLQSLQRKVDNKKHSQLAGCLLSQGGRFRLTHNASAEGSLVRFQLRDEHGTLWEHVADYSLLPYEWYHLVASFAADTHFLLAINGLVFTYPGAQVPGLAPLEDHVADPSLFCEASRHTREGFSAAAPKDVYPHLLQGDLALMHYWRQALSIPAILLLCNGGVATPAFLALMGERAEGLPEGLSSPSSQLSYNKNELKAAPLWPGISLEPPPPSPSEGGFLGQEASPKGGSLEMGPLGVVVLMLEGVRALQLKLHLNTLSLAATPRIPSLLACIIVVHIQSRDPALHEQELQSAVPNSLRDVVSFVAASVSSSWAQAVHAGLEQIPGELRRILVTDSGVQLTASTLPPLLHHLGAASSSAPVRGSRVGLVAGAALYPNGRVHSLGLEARLTPVLDRDLILPLERNRGDPVSVIAPKLWTGIVPGLCFVALRDALEQALRNASSDVAHSFCLSLAYADLSLEFQQRGFQVVLEPASKVFLLSKKHVSLDRECDYSSCAQSAGAFHARWERVLRPALAARHEVPLRVNWMMHCGASLAVEAMHILSGLEGRLPLRAQIMQPVPFCDAGDTVRSFPVGELERYGRLGGLSATDGDDDDVLIYHKDYRLRLQDTAGLQPKYIIARYLFEGSGQLSEPVMQYLYWADEVWVPSGFHKDVVIASGIASSRVLVVPEAVPARVMQGYALERLYVPGLRRGDFVFLSVFKLEDRKGWRELVLGFCRAFTAAEAVTLLLHTYLFVVTKPATGPWDVAFIYHLIETHLSESGCKTGEEAQMRPRILVIGRPLTHLELMRVYRTADAYVSAHWAEGWGLPLCEAMAMGLPTIATNWRRVPTSPPAIPRHKAQPGSQQGRKPPKAATKSSGNTEFMTEANSFLVPISHIEEYTTGEIFFQGLSHAVADVDLLMEVMRLVYSNPREARRRGEVAQRDIETLYSPEALADRILHRLREVQRIISAPAWAPREHLQIAEAPPAFVIEKATEACSGRRPQRRSPPAARTVLLMSVYPPEASDTAEHAIQLHDMLSSSGFEVKVVALQTTVDSPEYPAEVEKSMKPERKISAMAQRRLRRYIEEQTFRAVILQYDVKSFADWLLCFLKLVTVPLVTVLHGVHPGVSLKDAEKLRWLHSVSDRTVVTTELAQKLLHTQYTLRHMVAIPHAVSGKSLPPLDSKMRASTRAHYGWQGRTVLVMGPCIRPGMGYEYAIRALAQLAHLHPEVLLVLVGVPKKGDRVATGYHYNLKQIAERKGLQADWVDASRSFKQRLGAKVQVVFIARRVERLSLRSMLHAADIFVAPFLEDQMTDTTDGLDLAMEVGLVSVATKFLHAKWALRERRGVLVDFKDDIGLAEALQRLVQDKRLLADYASRLQVRCSQVLDGGSNARSKPSNYLGYPTKDAQILNSSTNKYMHNQRVF
ncbi:hypothetical protein CYMTET_18417 [Cymbomonas tetramitiformis]|uniref:Glycosyltransferase subfamily 4-like N-terminal domain-containing protein n=1 Tax=Cymbomonas tetramitiformis TaxID=36881 RepID=A0AAE0L5Y2_9CHLO|nr:hypothetical protein CYMTET_18417 [Cymbomonas tetramitiformis]